MNTSPDQSTLSTRPILSPKPKTDLTSTSFSPVNPHPITKDTLPITIGHEFSGTIVSLGPKPPRHLRPGMKVAIQPSIYCGACPSCKIGAENVCPSGGFVGLSGGGGGMSDEVLLPSEACHPLPSNVGLDVGALVEPLAVAWHAVDASPIADFEGKEEGAKCLVLGGGPIGLAVVQVLQARGASKIIVSEVSGKRQQFARQLGASNVLDPRQFDMVVSARQLTNGAGPDIVFDCAGVPQSLETACRVVRARGAVINVAIWEDKVPFDPNWLVFREARYSAVLGYQKKDYEGVIEALRTGRIAAPEKMITSRIGLEDLVEKGYGELKGERERHIKILIDMSVGA